MGGAGRSPASEEKLEAGRRVMPGPLLMIEGWLMRGSGKWLAAIAWPLVFTLIDRVIWRGERILR